MYPNRPWDFSTKQVRRSEKTFPVVLTAIGFPAIHFTSHEKTRSRKIRDNQDQLCSLTVVYTPSLPSRLEDESETNSLQLLVESFVPDLKDTTSGYITTSKTKLKLYAC